MLQNLETTYISCYFHFFSTLGNNSTLNGWKEDEHLIISSLLVPTAQTLFSQSSGQSCCGEAYWVLTGRRCPDYSWAVQCAVVMLPYLPIVLFFRKLSKLPFFFPFARLSTYFLLIQPQTLSSMESLTCLAGGYSALWLSSSCPGLWLLAAVLCCGFGGVSLPAQELTCSVSFWIIQSLGLVPPHYSPISLSFVSSNFSETRLSCQGSPTPGPWTNWGSFISIYSRSPLLHYTWAPPPLRSVVGLWWVV